MLQPIIKALLWKKNYEKKKQSVAAAITSVLCKQTLLKIWTVLSTFMESKVLIRGSGLLINDLLLYRELKDRKKRNKLKESAAQKLISHWEVKQRKNDIKQIEVTVKRHYSRPYR